MKHTPGPWAYDEPKEKWNWTDGNPDHLRVCDKNVGLVAHVYCRPSDKDREVYDRANLVITSPDLLEGLEEAVAFAKSLETAPYVKEWEAAIAKAKG